MTATLPLREALNESISSGKFEDTKALYANSHVLETVPYFKDLLSGTFTEAEPKDLSEDIDDDEVAEDYGYYSDSDLEDDIDHAARCANPLGTYSERRERPQQGKVIKVQDIAFITFQAFLLYLYTGYIDFAPYGSEENRKSRAVEIYSTSENAIPRPSPKSIYRLADKYDVPALKQFAWDSILDGLARCDTVEEAFSEFASKYQEVRNVQVANLAYLLFRGSEESTQSISERVDEKIDSYANGELDHAMEAMALLWEHLRQYPVTENIPSPSRAPVTPLAAISFDGRSLRTALVISIRKGGFFDRKYWVRHVQTAGVLQPIYISSIVAGEKLRHINGLVKLHWKDEQLDTGDGSDDSDHEDEPERAGELAPEAQADGKDKVKRELLPALTVGSFASWRSLFFFLCTDTMQFAPLKSQGASARAQYVREQAGSGMPPPCSPKGIYSLAKALEIKALCDLALDDIRSKITSDNLATELFSGFASRENDVMKMQCKLLSCDFLEKSTTSSVTGFIKSMVGGKAAHQAGALKLALRNGSPTRPLPSPPRISEVEHVVVRSPWDIAFQ